MDENDLVAMATRYLGDEAKARKWIKLPHPFLAVRRLLSLLEPPKATHWYFSRCWRSHSVGPDNLAVGPRSWRQDALNGERGNEVANQLRFAKNAEVYPTWGDSVYIVKR